jgi:hypothetical protein
MNIEGNDHGIYMKCLLVPFPLFSKGLKLLMVGVCVVIAWYLPGSV